MKNANEPRDAVSVKKSLTDQIIAAFFESLGKDAAFDEVCIEELKKLSRSGDLSKDKRVLAALRTKVNSE